MNEEKIIEKLITIEERLSKLDDKIGGMITRSEFITAHEETVTFLKKLDQERIFTIEWVKRIEADLEKVKAHLNIS